MSKLPAILAIESSCDDSAVAVVSELGEVVSHHKVSQIDLHKVYGGVVPELASRAHLTAMEALVKKVLTDLEEKTNYEVKKVVATMAPGLVGPLLVGATFAQGLASAWNLPFEGIHHLRGHLASVFLEHSKPEESLVEHANSILPATVLLISGGHTQLLQVSQGLAVNKIAETSDDAAGECFDKSAKLMGLSYPGGPAIESMAASVTSQSQTAVDLYKQLPHPKSKQGFSFSGLKTAIRLMVEKDTTLVNQPEFAWAVQESIVQSIMDVLNRHYAEEFSTNFIFCGGVSANQRMRQLMKNWCEERQLNLMIPPLKYCTDNAAMIAAAAWIQNEQYILKQIKSREVF